MGNYQFRLNLAKLGFYECEASETSKDTPLGGTSGPQAMRGLWGDCRWRRNKVLQMGANP